MALAVVPRQAQPTKYTGQDLRMPGMHPVFCSACGKLLFEYRAAVVKRNAGIRRALIIQKCKRGKCHAFTRFEIPEEMTTTG